MSRSTYEHGSRQAPGGATKPPGSLLTGKKVGDLLGNLRPKSTLVSFPIQLASDVLVNWTFVCEPQMTVWAALVGSSGNCEMITVCLVPEARKVSLKR